ncbi:uncharacterized protein [Nicotiana tomentosiformis]|uniref:uncharacterized protein n=1 Tax=Nicotiana tomentosiformis TaxID=4098 RepID=UPI00388C91C7
MARGIDEHSDVMAFVVQGTPPIETAPVPTPTEGATVPPTGIPVPAPSLASDSGVSDIDIRGAIQMLTQLVASQAQRSSFGPTSSSHPGESASSRVNKFLQLDPLVFTGTNPEEDPQDFIDDMHKTLWVMHAIETEGVELASYRLKGVAYSWFELWEEPRGEGSPPARWGKANVVADALSRKCMGSLAHLEAYQRPLAKEVH